MLLFFSAEVHRTMLSKWRCCAWVICGEPLAEGHRRQPSTHRGVNQSEMQKCYLGGPIPVPCHMLTWSTFFPGEGIPSTQRSLHSCLLHQSRVHGNCSRYEGFFFMPCQRAWSFHVVMVAEALVNKYLSQLQNTNRFARWVSYDLVSVVFLVSIPFVCYRMGFALGLGALPQKMLHGKLDQVQEKHLLFFFIPEWSFLLCSFLSLRLPLFVHTHF